MQKSLDWQRMNNKGTMEQKNKLIPELRFPEFVKDGEWEIKTLNEIAKFRRGSFPQPYGLPEWYDVNGFPFIQVFDVDDNFKLKTNTKSKISKAAAEQSVFIKKGTVIVTIQGSIGRVAITQYDAYIDRTLLLFEEYFKEINQVYFSYVLFKLFEIEKEKAPGGIIKTITKEVLSDFRITVPQIKEQQKIADCLSSLDELITAHNDKLETLKNHKKGLLQNLLYQTIRFKQINNQSYEDWKFVRFTDCCELIHGFQFREEHFTEKGIPIIKIGSLVDNGCLTFNNATYVDEKYRNSFSKFELKKGDILMALTGGTLGKVSRINDDYGLIFQNYRVGKFEPKDNAIKDFIYYILQSSLVQNKVKSLVNEAAQPNFGKQDFDKIEFFLPTIQEQQKIADCLLAVDNLITAQTEKVEQLKIHKKGLMQGLFPKIEE